MFQRGSFRQALIGLLVTFILLSTLLVPSAVFASSREAAPTDKSSVASAKQSTTNASVAHLQGLSADLLEVPQAPEATTLSVSIVSSPWVVVDHNDPAGSGGEVPKVFVVEAAIKNTGNETATDVVVTLNYQGASGVWVLLSGENPVRTVNELAPNQTYHAYWFARYATVAGSNFQYSVSAVADNAPLVSTSDNAYGNPAPGKTVATKTHVSTGNSGVVQTSANVVVGVAFTVTVKYDLGSNPESIIFSPVGNSDFKADAYHLLSTRVRFYNDANTQSSTVNDRLYFSTLPAHAQNADVLFTFIAVAPENTRLCPYGAIDFGSTEKYDNFYCDDARNTSVPISGSLSVQMTKTAGSSTILQGQTLNYTIHYENTGASPLQYVWIWDDVDTSIASINTASISPTPDADETTSSRIAWYIGSVAAAGQPGSSGTLSFSVTVNGNGADLANNTSLVNNAYFGISTGGLPERKALTKTAQTTVQAPVITVSKTDNQTTAVAGATFNYTLNVANTGPVNATNLVVSDVLPSWLSLNGTPTPAPTSQNGQTLTWNLGSLAATTGSTNIVVPVKVNIMTPNGTVLNNQMAAQYKNTALYTFATKMANDTTTVNAPVLTISKSDSPDPVLTDHEIIYTLHYVNSGPTAATNVKITDTIPADTSYVTCTASCSISSGVVTWNVGTVASGGSGDVTLTVLVSDLLQTGDLIVNDNYGISADQLAFIAGAPETTEVNRHAAVVQGYAFNDADGDGVKDPGETTGFQNVTISLSGTTVPLVTTTTDSNGFYSFRVESSGAIAVSSGTPAAHFRTTPSPVHLNATLGVTETVNFGFASNSSPFGVVFGTVFEDKNHDGDQDLGEFGLSGVSVGATSATANPVSTNNFGQYTLNFVAPVNTNIVETNPANYVSTTPDSVPLAVNNGSNNGSPINFGDFLGIQITGQVFEDSDVDGAKDVSESGLADAVVAVEGQSITTDSSGAFNFFVALADSNPITITETDPVDYVSTNAVAGNGMTVEDVNTLRIEAPVSGLVYANSYFGDVMASDVVTISGQVWNDNGAGGGVLANGMLDGTEPGLAGATITLSSGLSQMTEADGSFSLFAPAGQIITVVESDPATYVSTNAIPGNDASKVNNNSLQVGPLSAGQSSAGNLFGDVLSSNVGLVTGRVFDDMNENGLFGAPEVGLVGVQVTLAFTDGTSITVLTNSNGQYQFAVAPNVPHSITSAGPGSPYYATTPETIYFTVPAPGTYPNNNFGYSNDTDVAVITGIVFNDLNSDGEQDFGEAGLAGAVITLDGANPITTMANGLMRGTFTYAVPQTKLYALHEANPAGYRSTTPDTLNIDVDTLATSYFAEFGDTNSTNTGTVYGTVFDDLNGNGMQEANEAGLPGVVISMTVGNGVLTATTKAFGQYTYGLAANVVGFHNVREQDPALPGYRSTTPDSVDVFVQLNNSQVVNFGDTMNSSFSTIMGTVFDDDSGEGTQDPSELGIAGVVVSLSNGMTTTTNATGGYTFATTSTGFVSVIESDPVGYHSTTPNNVTVQVTGLGEVYTVNFGDSDNAQLASIFGTVFEDVDIDGQKDTSELGLPGVTVEITGTFPSQSSLAVAEATVAMTTNEWGQYTFLIENTGTFTVTESDLPGYVSTNAIPGTAAVVKFNNNNLRANVTTLGKDFGNNLFADVQASQVITVSGQVWNDNGAGNGTAGDGVKDAGEPGLAGALVSLSSGTSQKTGADGSFTLYGPTNQVLTLVETNPIGYLSTNAIPGNDATKVDDDTLTIAALGSGSVSTGNLFGDVFDANVALISGTVFEDSNGDGMMGAGESGIPNVTVTLDGASTTLTDIDGRYFFATDVPGVHSIVESDLPGYFSTTPNEVHLGVSAGQSYEVNFGDANSNSNFAAILGTVFADLDGDGQWDSNELGIPNVTVHLDDSSTTTTNQYGSYGFITDVAGVHQVNEEDPANYFSTTPNEVHVAVAMGQGYQVDFGDAPNGSGFAAVYGTVFEDANSDGQWDDEEVGIAGVTVALDGETAVTNAYGNYTLGTSSAGNHTVVETDLPGYVSTTPNIVNVNVALNNGYQIDFGDISNITCSPDSYEEDDTKNQAGSIIVNEAAQTHNFCEDATDWTTFIAEAGTVYTITTSAWGQRADTFLSLYDVNGTTMLMANDDYEGTTDYSSRIIWEATADGTYYVRTTNRAGLTQGLTEYDLSIEAPIINEVESPFIYMPIIFNSWSNDQAAAVKEVKLSKPRAPEGEINHFCPDAYETDDTWQEALAVADGDVQVHSFDSNPALYAADKDFVSVDLAAGQTVTFTITAVSNTETLLELYDENGDAMDVDGLTELSWTAKTAGHYYASVSPLNSMNFGCTNTVSYELTVAVSGEVPSPPMIFLPFVSKG